MGLDHIHTVCQTGNKGGAGPVPRAIGHARVAMAAGRLRDLYQSGASKILFPRTTEPTAVLLNTSGGVTGGDRFTLSARTDNGPLTVTTQAAERIYRAAEGVGRIDTSIDVGAGGQLSWLPQETILFNGAALDRHQSVTVAKNASALILESLIIGRHAMGERVTSAHLSDRMDITYDGAHLVRDRLALTGDLEALLDRPGIARGARAMASLWLVGPDAPRHLNTARSHVGATGGASLIREHVLFCRILAQDGFALRQTIIPLMKALRDAPLPRPWML